MTTIAPALLAPAPAVNRPTIAKINALAVTSLVVGILQFVVLFIPCWLVTIPFGVHALRETNQSDTVGRGAAIAGLALSATHFAIYTFVFVWLLTTR